MANGAAVARSFVPEPPTAPAATAPKPDEVPIEIAIGTAAASAVTAIAQALVEFQDGGLRRETKDAGAERIAKLYELQQTTLGELDFPTVARAEAKRVLCRCFPAEFYQRYGEGAGEVTMNLYIDAVLEILGKVTACERMFSN
jgi:hypothetical protein